MADFFTNNKRNLHTSEWSGRKLTKLEKRAEIIHNLENVIRIEESKVGGGNKELCGKFQIQIDTLKSKV